MVSLSIVIPIYNDAECVKPCVNRLVQVSENLVGEDYEIIFSVDPSSDNTYELIIEEHDKNNKVKAILLSRRFGQPQATIAALTCSNAHYTVVIDADLQDPPELIYELFQKAKEGYDVVYAQRRTREGETFLKKLITFVGYKVINKASNLNIPRNTGDFRIMSRRAVKQVVSMDDRDCFLRGLVSYVGFKQTSVLYDRDSRAFGSGHYNKFTGSLKIGLNGLFGFTTKPLDLIWWLSLFSTLLVIVLTLIYIFVRLSISSYIPIGITPIIGLITLFSLIQIMMLGVMAQYISRIFDQVMGRPRYIIQHRIGLDNQI
tara:strand:- start:522 stop:1469 length:948 start_codon:yes stop_codon:yes gene_type:complete